MKSITDAIINMISRIKESTLIKISFIITGIASTVWFMLRVIPKPQRATYPCMRATAPFMSGFVIWLLSLTVSVAAFRKAKVSFLRSNYLIGTLFLLAALAGTLFITTRQEGIASAAPAARWVVLPNQPVGTPAGIFPGRVVWVHDPAVATWDSINGNWWDDKVVSQAKTDKMMKESLISLTGEKSEKKAWKSLFRYFNSKHGRKNLSYQPGEKIAIKINTNNTYSHQDS
jgi:hypothetical protein